MPHKQTTDVAARGDSSEPRPSRRHPLLPWQRAFIEWLALQAKQVRLAEQLVQANHFIAQASPFENDLPDAPITKPALQRFKKTSEYRDYFDAMQADATKRARAKMESRLDKFVHAHEDGLHMAVVAGDHRTIPSYTNPILDRIWPRRDMPAVAQQITITLGPNQQAALADDAAVEVLDAQLVDEE